MISTTKSYRVLYLLLALFIHVGLFGQEEEFYNGVILSSEDRKPVSFATVRVVNYALGVVSNEDGSFRLPAKLQSYGDSLEISSLGYRDKIIRISDLDRNQIVNILLDPAVEKLEEVVVSAEKRRLSAEDIVKNALQRIPYNYPTNPYSYIGYYRDYQLIEQNYTNLNEAIIQIYDKGFAESDYLSTEARILALQKNEDFPRNEDTSVPYDYNTKTKIIPNATLEGYFGNELLILRIHDAIRNHQIGSFSYVDVLTRDFLKNHLFSKRGIISYKGDNVYRINISKVDRIISVKGEIYISAYDFGILKMDYNVIQTGIPELGTGNQDYGEEFRAREKLLYHIVVEYSRSDNYYLNYLSFNNYFEVNTPPTFYAKSLTWDKKNRVFMMEFSTPVSPKDVIRKSNIKIKFFGERILMDRVLVGSDGYKIQLKPKETAKQSEILALISKDKEAEKNFEVKFGRIKDINGNLINKSDVLEVEQYREYFVQQVEDKSKLPKADELMRKDQPIFGDQPVYDGELVQDFWMNTPLKK